MGGLVVIFALTAATAESAAILVAPASAPAELKAADLAETQRLLSDAVTRGGFRLVGPPAEIIPPDCADEACARRLRALTGCDWLLVTRFDARDGQLAVRLTLLDAVAERPALVQLNRVPDVYGIAALDLVSLTTLLLQSVAEPGKHRAGAATSPPEPVSTAAQAGSPPAEVAAEPPAPWSPRPLAPPAPTLTCPACSGDRDATFLRPEDWKRYERYRRYAEDPVPVALWVARENEESMALNVAWIAPPIALTIGLIARSVSLSALGLVLLPVAIVAGIVDAVDVGEVPACSADPFAERAERDPP
ncbi:MAG: hypothetical protein HY903_07570 [Deltaproteobacteria bacterium]|nr:hypothetical protein [Deltaproteobacteria bacterium]